MKKDAAITIVRAGNGWLVNQYDPQRDTSTAHVFQRKGYASGCGDYGPETLLEFIDAHFTDIDKTKNPPEQPPGE